MVAIKDIGTVVAERTFEGEQDGETCQILIKIGKPFPDENDNQCWYCPFSIHKGSEEPVLFYGAGIDSLQALRIALQMIDAKLQGGYSALKLTWLGESDLGLTGSP